MKAVWRDFGFLFLVSGILALFSVAIAAMQPYSTLPVSIARVVMPFAIVMWTTIDARRRRATPCFDFGFLMLLLWYVAVPWYLVRTRGWLGLPIALGFGALLLVPILSFVICSVAAIIAHHIARM